MFQNEGQSLRWGRGTFHLRNPNIVGRFEITFFLPHLSLENWGETPAGRSLLGSLPPFWETGASSSPTGLESPIHPVAC